MLDVSGTITKFNSHGEFVMTYGEKGTFRAGLPNLVIKAPKAITSDLFNNLYALSNPGLANDTTAIYKLDKEGKLLSIFADLGPNTETSTYTDLAVDPAGNMYVADLTGGLIHKLNSSGIHLGTIGSLGFGPGELWMPVAITIDKAGIIHVLDYNGGRIQQFDSKGNFIRQFGKFSKDEGSIESNSDMALDSKGNIHVASNLGQRRYFIFSSKGDLLYEALDSKVNHIAIDQLGTNLVLDDDQADGYSLYTANAYENPQSVIKGIVYNDANNDCILNEGERTLSGIVVMTNPGPYYAITDVNGGYTLAVTPAEYTLHTTIPYQEGRTITATCPTQEKGNLVKITDPGQLIQNINFGNFVYAPAHLIVSVNSTRRRRCFESTTTVRYVNSGFAPASDAKVYVKLPAEVELLSADKTYTRLPDGTYAFAVGDLSAGQSGIITIQDKVTCGDESVRGRTVCTRAWITPSNNAPAQPVPTISITGRCNSETGMIRFVIRNTGTADMEQHEIFRKFRDGRLSSKEQFQLAAGDSMVLLVPSMGYTWRLEADQPEGNGDNKLASVTIEACTDANSGITVSSGLVNLMPTDDEEAEKSEECMPITDSYDPNDKLVTPLGRTDELYTPTNTELKYKIRFQNTGTDVAYRVVVVDTLSEHLDLSTLQVGSASHAHRFEVSGKGRPVLTWTFDNIMLPDSNANEPGSHGYIQFSIKPKADLPEKTAVENFADIFFDYNSPVRTNITLNRIFNMPSVVDEEVRVDLEDILASPDIAAFAPAAGKFGTEITITGKRFATVATGNKVYLNGKAATVVSATASELRVLVPEGATTGVLKIITPDGGVTATDNFEVYQPPVLNSFSPAEGLVGQTVTLKGQHLSINQLPEVYLGKQQCEVSMAGSGELQVLVPAGATTGVFRISTEGGEVQSSQTYRVWQQPGITALNKRTDRAGSELRITGVNFAEQTARNKVYFGQAEASVLQATVSSLLVAIPLTAGTGKVKVVTPGGETLSDQTFELIPAPVLVQMQPAQGSMGTVVELRGQHFLTSNKQDTVSFNGIKAVVLNANPDLLKVQVPRGVSTGKVEIKGVGGAALSAQDFVVEDLTLAESVIISPNPSDGSFKLDLHRADFEARRLQVYSSLGQLVLEQSITAPRPDALQVQLPKPQSGIYLLHLHTDRGLLTFKLYVR
ncbi:DUF7619 domain-containing protein [Pontibacter anaerobius]|uniref:IPT/TIG domain-containing protein n=1 Tax=Pontibacter anaerobius TaxID=2993940 RepID=A0ABT3RGJ2_9BACT|nr:IPT/TIG domain-containing protein [Pontibacter anaerobius]MCX2740749.1 IPT/TIG domain-containing protein [Pontibacter anaerobius]